MAGRVWEDPRQQAAAQQGATASWDRIRQIRSSPTARQDATRLSDLSASYPHLRPGVAVPLARSGASPSDPNTQQVAQAEAKRNKRSHGWMGALGDLVPSPTHISHDILGIGRVGVAGLNKVGGAALWSAKSATRDITSVASFLPELGMGLYRNVAAVGGGIAAGASGGALAGTAAGLAGGPFAPVTVPIGAAVGGAVGGALGAIGEARGRGVESGGLVNPLAQTTLGQQAAGRPTGSGYFAGDEARAAATRAQQKAASVNGHALTPGRYLANTIVEPGSKPYTLLSGAVDLGVAWELDPAQHAGKAVGKWRKSLYEIEPAAKAAMRTEAGLVEGARNTVLAEAADRWLAGAQGSRATSWLADQRDFEAVRQALPGVDVSTVMDLTKAEAPDDVAKILREQLGVARGLEAGPKVGTKGMEVSRSLRDKFRLLHDLPSGELDFSRPTEAVDQFHLLLRDANVPAERAAGATRRMAEALLEGTPEGKLTARRLVRDEFFGAIGDEIDQTGDAGNLLRKLNKDISTAEQRIYGDLVAADGTQTAVKAVSWGGKSTGLPPTGLLPDFLDTGLEIDRNTIRGIRTATGRLAPLLSHPWARTSISFGDHAQSEVWKPLQLIRGAWTVRVIGEEQIRMAAAGRLSMFNHPLSYLAWAIDDDSHIAGILNKLPGSRTGVGQVGVTGERFSVAGTKGRVSAADSVELELRGASDDYAAAANIRQQVEGHLDGTLVRQRHTATYRAGEDGYYNALAERIDQLHGDPLVRSLAERGLDDTRVAFSHPDGDLNALRKDLVAKGAPLDRSADVDAHLANAHRNLTEATGAASPATQGQLGLEFAEGGGAADPFLVQAVREGHLGGVPIRDTHGRINKDFVSALRHQAVPETITGAAFGAPDKLHKAKLDQAVRFAFTHFMAQPSARLSRSPTFRQHYWDEAPKLIHELDEGAQATLLEAAREAKLTKAQIARIEKAGKRGTGALTAEQADLLLKGRALDATRDLLYDVSQKGQLSDVLRLVMPFAEAQKEVMTVWARIGTSNPATFRKAQQLVQGARGSGAFYTDDQTGEEMFTFPGGEWLTEHTLGLPIKLAGRVQGLNMFGSGIMPGMGPMVQLPARWILPDKPAFDDLRNFVDPFGASAEGKGLLEQNLPAYMTKLQTALSAPDSDRVFANTVKDVWASGLSSGRYSSETPEDISDGLEDAKRMARGLYLIRGLASVLGAPTAPTPRMMAKDKEGHWLVAQTLADDYRKMLDDSEIGPEGASAAFLDKYGNNAAAYLQAKTYSTGATSSTTSDAASWLRSNQAVAKKYPEIAGLFAPTTGDFDYTQYLRNIKAGTTISLTPDQYVKAANNKVGAMIYYQQADRLGPYPSQPQREWLHNLRVQIREALPGYDEALPGKPDRATVTQEFIPQIERAVNDPALAGNEVAQATKVYLAARAKANEAAQAGGYASAAQAKGAAPQREWLRNIAGMLQKEVPGFSEVWSRVFDRELQDDSAPTAAVTTP